MKNLIPKLYLEMQRYPRGHKHTDNMDSEIPRRGHAVLTAPAASHPLVADACLAFRAAPTLSPEP